MDFAIEFLQRFISQFQSPALAFLLGGMALAAFGSKLQIPDAIYKFCVFMLLMKIGLEGDFLSAIMPAIRYESLDPMEYYPSGGTAAEDKTTVIDFCLNFYNGDNHDIQLGGRNVGFEADGVDGYTDMYLGWRMRF